MLEVVHMEHLDPSFNSHANQEIVDPQLERNDPTIFGAHPAQYTQVDDYIWQHVDYERYPVQPTTMHNYVPWTTQHQVNQFASFWNGQEANDCSAFSRSQDAKRKAHAALAAHGAFTSHDYNLTPLQFHTMNTNNRVVSKRSSKRRCRTARSSKFRGVSDHTRDLKWMSRAWINGKIEHLGCYSEEELAAIIVDLRKIEVCGADNAKLLNFKTAEQRIEVALKFDGHDECPNSVKEFIAKHKSEHQSEKNISQEADK
uniref:AP2/ERF domain-containing protein n=1 Tax=Mucochytrium quahogii TaxID=96639 RepID=A0A7S2W909_9STRA|mmetsp:Transcript_7703/g.12467  ORF Transcript_7703/g.12467 Transcript_7703/m.12467 type:complete len:257 (-) Transcript_7703:192-962(-)